LAVGVRDLLPLCCCSVGDEDGGDGDRSPPESVAGDALRRLVADED
jgi:hypothetical protein